MEFVEGGNCVDCDEEGDVVVLVEMKKVLTVVGRDFCDGRLVKRGEEEEEGEIHLHTMLNVLVE